MRKLSRWVRKHKQWVALGVASILFVTGLPLVLVSLAPPRPVASEGSNGRLITVYDSGQKVSFMTSAKTLGEALGQRDDITLHEHDAVEPSLKEELVAPEYKVNIYRARLVTIIDGQVRVKTVSAFQTAERIAKGAGIVVYPEDRITISQSVDFDHNGIGVELAITRATPVSLTLHGVQAVVRTQAKTIGAMLTEKGIKLDENGRTAPGPDSLIQKGMAVRVWREGQQTITVSEPISVPSRYVFDADREVGFREVQTAGVVGERSVTYVIEIKDGTELSRRKVSELTLKQPVQETVRVGVKPGPKSLTKSKGAHIFIDSKGVSHRETYYDLDMGVVMGACGQRGQYTVRPDGAKIDSEGYVIIAAHLGRYPRCSVVETSLGSGRVYDTGGFVVRHPDGFDLATDWTNYNGR